MRPKQSLESLLRTPFKTILTFLLIAVASFALFSRVTDYAIIAREMSQAENSYRGVAALDNGVTDTVHYQYSNMPATANMISPFDENVNYFFGYAEPDKLTNEQIEAFSALSEISTVDVRFMTGGIIRDYRRLEPRVSKSHDWGYDYTARFVIEGTFSDWSDDTLMFSGNNRLNFVDIKNLAGDAQIEDGGMFSILAGSSPIMVYDFGSYHILFIFTYTDADGEEIRMGDT